MKIRRCRHCNGLLRVVNIPNRGPVTTHAIQGAKERCQRMLEIRRARASDKDDPKTEETSGAAQEPEPQ